jgi:hypothetical protein
MKQRTVLYCAFALSLAGGLYGQSPESRVDSSVDVAHMSQSVESSNTRRSERWNIPIEGLLALLLPAGVALLRKDSRKIIRGRRWLYE